MNSELPHSRFLTGSTASTLKLPPELRFRALCFSQNRDDGSTMNLRIHKVGPRLLDLTPLLGVLGAVVDAFDARDLVR